MKAAIEAGGGLHGTIVRLFPESPTELELVNKLRKELDLVGKPGAAFIFGWEPKEGRFDFVVADLRGMETGQKAS